MLKFQDQYLKATMEHHLGTAQNRAALGGIEAEAVAYCRTMKLEQAIYSPSIASMTRKEAIAAQK